MVRVHATTKLVYVTAFRKSSRASTARIDAALTTLTSTGLNAMLMVNVSRDSMNVASGLESASATTGGLENRAMNTTRLRRKHNRLRHRHSGQLLTPSLRVHTSPASRSTSFWVRMVTLKADLVGKGTVATKVAWTPPTEAISRRRWAVISLRRHRLAVPTTMLDSIHRMWIVTSGLRHLICPQPLAASTASHTRNHILESTWPKDRSIRTTTR